jgi:hypothetical protein
MFYLKRRKKRIRDRRNQTVPANIWFYSKLINYELSIEKVNPTILMNTFFEYLARKYDITKYDLKQKTIFQHVSEKELNLDYIELYGDIYHSIKELKHKNKSDVISYIKIIKVHFNKDNLTEWIEKRKDEKCNNC